MAAAEGIVEDACLYLYIYISKVGPFMFHTTL